MISQPDPTLIVALCSCPAPDAEPLASALVKQRLAACVKVVGPVQSTYRWQGEVQRADEHLLIIKTLASQWNALQQWLSDHHPYEVPELIALPAESVSSGYLNYVVESVA